MKKSEFDQQFDDFNRTFESHFKGVEKTVKRGATLAFAGAIIWLVILACAAAAAVWAVGHYILHAW